MKLIMTYFSENHTHDIYVNGLTIRIDVHFLTVNAKLGVVYIYLCM